MNKKDRLLNISMGFIFLVALVFLSVIALNFGTNTRLLESREPKSLSENWRLEATGEPVALPVMLKVKQMEPITIVSKIPPDERPNTTILFRSFQQQVRVELDGALIYAYGEIGSHPFIKSVPGNWNLILLPDGYEGSEIKITLMSAHSSLVGKINDPLIGGYDQCTEYIQKQQVFPFASGIASVFVSFILFITYFLYERKRAGTCQLLYSGGIILCTGVWTISQSRMTQFYLSNAYIIWAIMPLALFFISVFLAAREKEYIIGRKGKRMADKLIGFGLAAILVSIILQITGIRDLTQNTWLAYALLLVTTVFIGVSSFKYTRDKMDIVWKSLIGLIIGVTLLIEMLLFSSGMYVYIESTVSMTTLVVLISLGGIELHKLLVKADQTELMREKLKNERLLMINSQIKPHFVYNVLGAIYGQVKSDPDVAEKLVYDFSKYLRSNMEAADSDTMILFTKELQHVRVYTNIEEVRFNGSVCVVYQIECSDFYLPPLTIQPLVENAIKHGLCQKEEGGTVWVRAKEYKDTYVITVTDDGVGFDPKQVKEDVGLESVRIRLRERCRATLSIKSILGKGTTVTVTFPKKEIDSYVKDHTCR